MLNFITKKFQSNTKTKKISLIGMVIKDDTVYIPSKAYTEDGLYVQCEPVYKTSLDFNEIKEVFSKVYEAGHIIVKDLDDPRVDKDILLKTSKFKSWKQLSEDGYSFTVSFGYEDKIVIYVSYVAPGENWRKAEIKEFKLDKSSTVDDIVKFILQYYKENKAKI